VREKQIRKLQKDRHLAEIAFTLLRNPTFKNLSRSERHKMAKLIYKAELLEMEIKSKDMSRTLLAFQDLINQVESQMIEGSDDDEDDDPFFGR